MNHSASITKSGSHQKRGAECVRHEMCPLFTKRQKRLIHHSGAESTNLEQEGDDKITDANHTLNGRDIDRTTQPQQESLSMVVEEDGMHVHNQIGHSFGVPVNGFHPQWSANPNIAKLPQHIARRSEIPPSQVVVQSKISRLLSNARRDEVQRARQRRELVMSTTEGVSPGRVQKPNEHSATDNENNSTSKRLQEEQKEHDCFVHKTPEDGSVARSHSPLPFSDLYSDIFLNSDVPQALVTPGGRFVAWNNIFLETTGIEASILSFSMTLFNLVIPKMLPKLIDLFALALRGGSPPPRVSGELEPNKSFSISSSSQIELQAETPNTGSKKIGFQVDKKDHDENIHPSMTVPCVQFPCLDDQIYTTITLMNDIDPDKRCFHCILSPHERLLSTMMQGSSQEQQGNSQKEWHGDSQKEQPGDSQKEGQEADSQKRKEQSYNLYQQVTALGEIRGISHTTLTDLL